MIQLKMMCDKCFRLLGDNEPMFGFKLIDDEGTERGFKGHEGCVEEMLETMHQLYGAKERVEDGEQDKQKD